MKKLIAFFIPLVLVSCTKRIELSDLIDKNASFSYTIDKNDPLSSHINMDHFKMDTIRVNSKKWHELMTFLSNNSNGWKSTPASYIGQLHIHQNNFNLLMLNNGVVLSFKDEDGRLRQYVKPIKQNELNFMFIE